MFDSYTIARRGIQLVIVTIGLMHLSLFAAISHASSPRLNTIMPRGVQRGHQHELVFSGERLQQAEEILFYDTGVTVTKIEQLDNNQVKVTVDVAADCRLGEHVAQVRTRRGISDYRSFYVGSMPHIEEVEPNNEFEQPQRVENNVTVHGVIRNEDADWFVITAKKGARLSAEVEAVRLASVLDPYVAILDKERFELAAVDDTALLKQDCYASILVPEDGEYYIVVREASYRGNDAAHYQLHVGSFPRPSVAYPAGGKPGTTTKVTYLGDPLGPIDADIAISAETGFRDGLFIEDATGISPSPVNFRQSTLENLIESEPNDQFETANVGTLPMAFNGLIQSDGDSDFYKFSAKQGQAWEIECYARRVGSGLDPVIHVWDANKKYLAGNDDARGPDSYLRFQAPADGDYYVRVMDHLNNGTATSIYRLEISPVEASLNISIPRVDRYSQQRQTIVVPRGNRFATQFLGVRANFGGEIKLDESQLPPGIKMVSEPMAANLTLMPVVFEAAADAPVGGKLIDFKAAHVDEKTGISGSFYNLADFVLGEPNNARYYGCTVDKLAIAVVDEVPFTLEIVQPNSPLVRNGQKELKIVAHRKEGFDEAINVEFPFRPPGVGAAGQVTIPKGQNEAKYLVNANGNAQIGNWPIYALGSSNDQGPVWVSSQLAKLEIAEPYVTLEMKRASCEQGQPAQIVCTLNQISEFEGSATAELLGLPPNVTAEPKPFDKTTKELVFSVTTSDQTPPGNHKSLFCRVTVTQNGEPVLATAGSTELQVSQPLPKPAEQAKPQEQAAQAPPVQQTAKPLSRLEKLRQQAKEQKENENQ
jgi:hypothetical protein